MNTVMEPTRSMTQRDLLRVDCYNEQARMNTESTRRALYIGLSFRSTLSVDMLQQDCNDHSVISQLST